MVGWWRDEGDAGNGVARLGDDFIHLKSWQLTALARLRSLCHLNLNLLCIDQVLGRYAKSSRCHLLGFA